MIDLRQLTLKVLDVSVQVEGLEAFEVRLRELPAGELVKMRGEDQEMVFRLLASCIVDGQNETYMTEADVKNLPWRVIVELTDPVMKLNGMVEDEKKS